MINNYQTFLLENVSMSLEMIINIIKSLKGNENKELVNKLTNYADKNGKTVLMSIVQSNNQELIDYILKYKINLQAKDKIGRNILFYCKNIKTFKNFYDLGVDPKATMKIKKQDEEHKSVVAGYKNILHYLSSKNIFNVDIYERLIRDGISINDTDAYGNSVIVYSILNKGIIQLLLKNGAKIDDIEIQQKMMVQLFDAFKWYKTKRSLVISIFKMLFDNGIEFNMYDLSKILIDLDTWYSEKVDMVENFIKPLLKYFNEDKLLSILKHYHQNSNNSMRSIEFSKRLLNLGIYPKMYTYLQQYYRNSSNGFNEIFKDYIKNHPYIEDSEKYNI